MSQSQIAEYIGVSQATVSKELSRNLNSLGHYSPKDAQMFADMRKERLHRARSFDGSMEAFVRKSWRRSSGHQSRSAAMRSRRGYRLCPWKGYTNISGKTGKTEGNYTCIAAIGSSTGSDMSERGARTYPTGSAYTNVRWKSRADWNLGTLKWI